MVAKAHALSVSCFVLLFAVAVFLEPRPSESRRTPTLAPPPPTSLLDVASLSRRHAAADMLWLRVVQYIGAPGTEERGYPGLGPWVHRIVEVSPRFESAYLTGGILLSTSQEQATVAGDLLDRAEEALVPAACRAPTSCAVPPGDLDTATLSETCSPCAELADCSWEIPLWRAFIAYFGELDTKTAARNYCESRRRGGPTYLTSFAARLLREADTCASLRRNLADVLARGRADNDGNSRLVGGENQLRIVLNCEERAIEQAAGAFRLRFGRSPDNVDEMVSAGLLEPPFAPPGQCWALSKKAWTLEPCSPPSR